MCDAGSNATGTQPSARFPLEALRKMRYKFATVNTAPQSIFLATLTLLATVSTALPEFSSRLTPLQTRILDAPPTSPCSRHFSFDDPAGPQFTRDEQQAQRDAGARLLPLVMEAFRSGAESVRIPPGNYRFAQERWDRDGVICALEFTGLQRDDAHPFTIDATGATFWFDLADDQAPHCHFCVGFKDCRNLVFRGATIDRATRGHVEGRITQFDFVGNRIELQLSPGIVLPEKFNDKFEQRVVPFKADGKFCTPLYALQTGGVHLKYKTLTAGSVAGRCWVTMADAALLATVRARGSLGVGDGLSCIYTVSSALELVRCRNLTMDGIRVYAAKAWGAERDGYGAHLWKNCYFGPRPGTSQWQGGEGFMFNATRHGTTLDNVTIRHTTDDTANVHGYWSRVESVADRVVTFLRNGETRRPFPRGLEIGDSILFYERNSGNRLGRASVIATNGNTVTLDQSAASFTNAVAEWPEHECAGWTIQRCDWHDNYQRLLIQSGPGIVRDCAFTRHGSSIELNSVFPYVEGGVPRDIVITRNTFTDVNPQPGGAVIESYVRTFHGKPSSLLHGIVITTNTFYHPRETVIALDGAANPVISGNKINPNSP